MNYREINANTIDRWINEGWEWGRPVDHETYEKAKQGIWNVVLTPLKPVPHDWFEGNLEGRKILGLASGGGQQMPVFAALGAECTILDYSEKQLDSERMVSQREGYDIHIVKADMTQPLPFADESFDLIFHPVSNCYIETVEPLFKECFRILKKNGILLGGYDLALNYVFDNDERTIVNSLPFNPLENEEHMKQLQEDDAGIQFSHTLEEQIGGQLKAGFRITDLYEDYNSEGNLAAHHIASYIAVRAVK